MTAPTPRETADHIGEANEKVTADYAELARLAEVLFTMAGRHQETYMAAATGLRALLSQIAALRGELEASREEADRLAYRCDDARLAAVEIRAAQAERQRDEARAVIKDVDQAARQAASMDEAGYTVTVQRTATHIYGITAAFLANQGADQ